MRPASGSTPGLTPVHSHRYSTNGVRNPLNRSHTLVAISKMPIGESNHHRFTTLAKSGNMMKVKVHSAHHPDEITPKAANALGI